MRDFRSSFVAWLMAICCPSAAITWSLLQRVAKPVGTSSGSPGLSGEILAVGRPVRRFDPIRKFLDDGARAVRHVQYFEDTGYLFVLRGRYCCDEAGEEERGKGLHDVCNDLIFIPMYNNRYNQNDILLRTNGCLNDQGTDGRHFDRCRASSPIFRSSRIRR